MNTDPNSSQLSQNEAIKEKVKATIDKIREEYEQRINYLEQQIKENKATATSLAQQLEAKENQLNGVLKENDALRTRLTKIQGYLQTIRSENESLIHIQQESLENHELIVHSLKKDLEEKEKELKEFKNIDMMSFDQSSVSVRDMNQQSFSLEISEVFRNSPQQMLKFLESIEGEKPIDEKEHGNMICMFVSKDGLSLQKHEGVNRSFLKRAIKEHEKRFRFVLIYKPDKVY